MTTAQLAQLLYLEASVFRSASYCLQEEIDTVGGGFYRSLRPLRTLAGFAVTLQQLAVQVDDLGHQLDVSVESTEGTCASPG